ncbi:MAG: MmcQ/YjbR family DNA-binding protein [Devosia sp.]
MATPDDVQRIALSLPGTTLEPRWGSLTFRRSKTYAVLREDGAVLLRLALADQAQLVRSQPSGAEPYVGRGPKGLTTVRFGDVDLATLETALRSAWRNAAPVNAVEL